MGLNVYLNLLLLDAGWVKTMRKEAHFIKDYWNKNEWTDSFVYAMLHSDLEGARQQDKG